jgi:hypothetical protein
MQIKHIEERNIVLPKDYKNDISYRVTGFTSEEGLLAIPVVPVVARCRFDIQERLEKIVEDQALAEKILAVIDEEFPSVMNEYRIKARIDNELNLNHRKNLTKDSFKQHFISVFPAKFYKPFDDFNITVKKKGFEINQKPFFLQPANKET